MREERRPGVHIEETHAARVIEGAASGVAAIVGPTSSGTRQTVVRRLTNLRELLRAYGGSIRWRADLPLGERLVLLTARAFFASGGRELWLASVAGRDVASYRGTARENGLAALEHVPAVDLVLTPAAALLPPAEQRTLVHALDEHCARMRYRMALIDPPLNATPMELLEWRASFDSPQLALYYPWIRTRGGAWPRVREGAWRRFPRGREDVGLAPPSGFVAGLIARHDRARGVHRAPAGVPLTGALGFERDLGEADVEALAMAGVNVLLEVPGRGPFVWGARTLASDPDWRYLGVRRYALYLERSIEEGTRWVAFERNSEQLWRRVRLAIEQFLLVEWKLGRLAGADSGEAFFVRCDRATMSAADLVAGRLVCIVGFAPLRPGEFRVLHLTHALAEP